MDDLIYLYETCDKYAIVLISGKKTMFYLHCSNNTHLIREIETDLPNSHKTGGQSAQRFERIRNEKIGWYIKKIVELMVQYYVTDGLFKYKGIILAGPSQLKEKIQNHHLYIKYFSKYLLTTLTVAEIESQTITEVIHKCSDILLSSLDDIKLIEEFELLINNNETVDLITFGSNFVMDSFKNGSLKDLYVYYESQLIEKIIVDNKKTNIKIFKCKKFMEKYGEVVGIRYYSQII